jgi:hypothetical protein
MDLKIDRYQYKITKDDLFLDNGSCIQLMSQSHEKRVPGCARPWPVLSKKAIKQISDFVRIEVQQHTYKYAKVFRLKIGMEK